MQSVWHETEKDNQLPIEYPFNEFIGFYWTRLAIILKTLIPCFILSACILIIGIQRALLTGIISAFFYLLIPLVIRRVIENRASISKIKAHQLLEELSQLEQRGSPDYHSLFRIKNKAAKLKLRKQAIQIHYQNESWWYKSVNYFYKNESFENDLAWELLKLSRILTAKLNIITQRLSEENATHHSSIETDKSSIETDKVIKSFLIK